MSPHEIEFILLRRGEFPKVRRLGEGEFPGFTHVVTWDSFTVLAGQALGADYERPEGERGPPRGPRAGSGRTYQETSIRQAYDWARYRLSHDIDGRRAGARFDVRDEDEIF